MKLLFGIVLVTMIGFHSFGQASASSNPTPPSTSTAKAKPMHHENKMPDAATRAQHEADRLAKMLTLDDATKQKVYDASLAHSTKVDEINAAGGKDQAAFKANKEAFNTALQGILTPDQFTKYMASQKHDKSMHHDDHGKVKSDDKK